MYAILEVSTTGNRESIIVVGRRTTKEAAWNDAARCAKHLAKTFGVSYQFVRGQGYFLDDVFSTKIKYGIMKY